MFECAFSDRTLTTIAQNASHSYLRGTCHDETRLSIGRAVNLFGLIVTLGCIAILWTGVSALSELKVNGPIYRQIVLGKDLIADILPPPEYVIESYLESTLLLNDPASLEAAPRAAEAAAQGIRRSATPIWKELRGFRPGQQAVDRRGILHARLALLERGRRREFLPAIEKGDMEAARKAYADIAAAYADHRAVVDKMVARATEMNAATEVAAAESESSFTIIIWSVAGIVLATVIGGVHRHRSRRDAPAHAHDRRHEAAGRRADGHRDPLRRPQGRDRIDGRGRRHLPPPGHRSRAAAPAAGGQPPRIGSREAGGAAGDGRHGGTRNPQGGRGRLAPDRADVGRRQPHGQVGRCRQREQPERRDRVDAGAGERADGRVGVRAADRLDPRDFLAGQRRRAR